MNKADYQKGYKAGKRYEQNKNLRLHEEIKLKLRKLEDERAERVYMQCLDLVLKYCNGWSVNNKKLSNAYDYCRLAKIFCDNSISRLDSQ